LTPVICTALIIGRISVRHSQLGELCQLGDGGAKIATPQSIPRRGIYAQHLGATLAIRYWTATRRHQHALIIPLPIYLEYPDNITDIYPGMAEPAPVGREVVYCGGEQRLPLLSITLLV
jgi:hypothetical protein